MSQPITIHELKRIYPGASESTLRRNQVGGVAPAPHAQPGAGNDHVATDAAETHYQGRCRIVVTSFRLRLCDGPHDIWEKHAVDALVEAGIVADDSEKEIELEVKQVKVERAEFERTEITIEQIEGI